MSLAGIFPKGNCIFYKVNLYMQIFITIIDTSLYVYMYTYIVICICAHIEHDYVDIDRYLDKLVNT